MIHRILICLFGLLVAGCASNIKKLAKNTEITLNDPFYDNHFTGLLVVDSESHNTVLSQNSRKYFTPASNTKIFTLYTALHYLPEKIPSLKYLVQNDTLYVEGTGDPSLLHPHLKDSTALEFLRGHKNIALHLNNIEDETFAPGWSWGDYQFYYQPERNALPIYGNVATIFNSRGLKVKPSLFKDKVVPINFSRQRDLHENRFYFGKSRTDTVEIPFKTDSTLTRQLLERALGKKIKVIDRMPAGNKNVLYGIASDTLYRRMMHESDNMVAEQLLLLASSTLSDTLNSGAIRDSILADRLPDLKEVPRWVDGSGLSRYNLFTPASMVHVLQKLYDEIPRERLFQIFPQGGVSGTLENWYAGNGDPYIFGKSGSLGNNYCLSGYLVTNSGKTLIFSFMNNHFRSPSSEVKKRVQRIFEEIRDTY